jgi:hypothetical protein
VFGVESLPFGTPIELEAIFEVSAGRRSHDSGKERRRSNSNANENNMRMLMVLTSHDQLGNTGRKTGFWREEFAAPYYVFRNAGVDLTLASPKGGQPPIDPNSDLPENQTPALAQFKKTPEAQNAFAHTLKLRSRGQQ